MSALDRHRRRFQSTLQCPCIKGSICEPPRDAESRSYRGITAAFPSYVFRAYAASCVIQPIAASTSTDSSARLLFPPSLVEFVWIRLAPSAARLIAHEFIEWRTPNAHMDVNDEVRDRYFDFLIFYLLYEIWIVISIHLYADLLQWHFRYENIT